MNGQALKLSKHDHFFVGPLLSHDESRNSLLGFSKHMVLQNPGVDDHDHLYLYIYTVYIMIWHDICTIYGIANTASHVQGTQHIVVGNMSHYIPLLYYICNYMYMIWLVWSKTLMVNLYINGLISRELCKICSKSLFWNMFFFLMVNVQDNGECRVFF